MTPSGGAAHPARRAPARALAVALLAAAGCGAAAAPPPPPGSIVVTLGGAASDGSGFVPLAGDVTLVPGAQGGFHVWMKYRVTGAPVESVQLAYTIRRVSDDRLVLTAMRQQDLGAAGDSGYWEVPAAIPAFMCPSPIGVQVRDLPMRLKLDMSTADGAPMATTTSDFTPHCPDGDQAAHCQDSCSG